MNILCPKTLLIGWSRATEWRASKWPRRAAMILAGNFWKSVDPSLWLSSNMPSIRSFGLVDSFLTRKNFFSGLSFSNGAWRWQSGASFDQTAFSGFPLPKKPKDGMAVSFKFIDQNNGMYKPALILQNKTKQLQFACQLGLSTSLPE